MSEEDDWFERALRDLDEDSDGEAGGESDANGEADDNSGRKEELDDDRNNDDRDGGGDDRNNDERDGDDDRDGGGDDGRDGARAEADDSSPGGDDRRSFGEDDPFVGGVGNGPDEPAKRRQRPAPGSSSGGEPSDPFGGYRGTEPSRDDDFGFADFGSEEGGERRGSPPSEGAAGREGSAGSTGFDVDPDEFESSIDRTDVGIEGLDEMILGGVPSRSLLSVIGGAGTGKTTFSLQFLNETLESDGKGVYITLEQTRESIVSTAEERGWPFREYADEGRLAVVAIDPIEMANSLASIRNDLTRLIAEYDADRLVLDSVSLLEMMYDHPAKRRSEVFGFTRSLKEAGVTTLLTSEASEGNPYASRHGIVEYLTDAVFVLRYVRDSDFRETRLAVEILKIRDANHSRETKPYEITDSGISVYEQANIF
ncbi:KaiC domain-containing protein [Halorubrum trueperi]|uniref:KaiC domain-containing protein n=1 Tax=Halorubrum trueperi TaxID=2004704 RepID=A0ABD5UQ97_9EURY